MKVLCLIDNLGAGGAQRQMVYLATSLKKAGNSVSLITYQDSPFYLNDIQKNGINYKYIAKAKRHSLRVFYINRAIVQYSPDIVIAYLDTPCIVACICRLMQFGKWKLVVSERNTTQTLNKREWLKFQLYRTANKIVANSYSQANYILKHFPWLESKVLTIVNMVDLSRFSPLHYEKQLEYLRIIVAATVAPSKNTKGFIEAVKGVVVKGITNFKVCWFGMADTPYCNEAVALIEYYQLRNYIEILPKSKTIEEEYRQSDYFCLPSFFEGTPNAICEAMACGLPILCSDICDNGRYVQESINGCLFNPNSVENMEDVLARALSLSIEDRISMGTMSRKIAEQSFSYSVFSQKYLDVVYSLCE